MKKRQLIVAGNWKMNKNYEEGRDLAKDIVERLQPSQVIVILATPFIHLNSISNIIKGVSNLKLGAQNCHQEESGAYTGEVSSGMLKSVGVDYVIVGHSERREYFEESDALLAKKVNIVLEKGMTPIFCCGEKLEVREANQHLELVENQIKNALFHLLPEEFEKIVIAYEPVWAIGTGKTASPEQAQEMHLYIRNLLAKQYGEELAQATTILYGGSVNAGNAKDLFQQADVDGGLVGGASLKAEDFVMIVNSF
ncbi:MAG: triose-phosphate isomerase [Saprospiraceae bacterium]|nr:triose-phosphate isomerase [Saprospiraceae bacterium]